MVVLIILLVLSNLFMLLLVSYCSAAIMENKKMELYLVKELAAQNNMDYEKLLDDMGATIILKGK